MSELEKNIKFCTHPLVIQYLTKQEHLEAHSIAKRTVIKFDNDFNLKDTFTKTYYPIPTTPRAIRAIFRSIREDEDCL
ncbi:MAG TPA: hypothetical protein DHS57_03665 [Erysipelotrichaceae bacterium]|nr:hypothetical protein [Erysipelotrichaceae bacterium]